MQETTLLTPPIQSGPCPIEQLPFNPDSPFLISYFLPLHIMQYFLVPFIVINRISQSKEGREIREIRASGNIRNGNASVMAAILVIQETCGYLRWRYYSRFFDRVLWNCIHPCYSLRKHLVFPLAVSLLIYLSHSSSHDPGISDCGFSVMNQNSPANISVVCDHLNFYSFGELLKLKVNYNRFELSTTL